MKRRAVQITILLFGLFYLFSGIIKIIDIDNFLFLIRSYRVKQLLFLAPFIPVIEIILGLLLIFRIKIKYSILFSTILLFIFTLIFSLGHFVFGIDDCGCFGGVDFLKMSPVIFYLRNGILISLSVYLYYNIPTNKLNINLYNLLALLIITSISSVFVGQRSQISKYTKKTPYTRTTINKYHDSFINKNINETILSQYVKTSGDSTYLIFIFSYKCPHCLISSVYLNDYVNNNTVDKVLGLTKGTRKEERFYKKNVKPNFEYTQLKFIDINMITGFYPLSFYVQSDTIRFKVKGALPTYDKFQDLYLDNKE